MLGIAVFMHTAARLAWRSLVTGQYGQYGQLVSLGAFDSVAAFCDELSRTTDAGRRVVRRRHIDIDRSLSICRTSRGFGITQLIFARTKH